MKNNISNINEQKNKIINKNIFLIVESLINIQSSNNHYVKSAITISSYS